MYVAEQNAVIDLPDRLINVTIIHCSVKQWAETQYSKIGYVRRVKKNTKQYSRVYVDDHEK